MTVSCHDILFLLVLADPPWGRRVIAVTIARQTDINTFHGAQDSGMMSGEPIITALLNYRNAYQWWEF